MKILKTIIPFLLMPFLMVSFHNCSTVKMLPNESPFEIGEAYYQESNSDTKLYIPIKSNSNHIILDSVYFQGKKAKLVLESPSLAMGRFKTKPNKKQDIIMSNEPYAEYGNQVPMLPEKFAFDLKDDECMVRYKEGNTIKYFKIKNIIKKEATNYPVTSNNN